MLAAATSVNPGVVGDARRRDDRATGTIGGSGEHHTRFYVSVWTASGRSGHHSKSGVGGYGVLDRAYCHRLVAWFPSCQKGGVRRAEEKAVVEAARLNSKHGVWPTPLTEGVASYGPDPGHGDSHTSAPSVSGDPQEEGRVIRHPHGHHAASNRGGQ